MRRVIFIVTLFFSILNLTNCQTTSQINRLIADLSWESIHVRKSFQTFFASDYENTGVKYSELLFNSLDDPEKTAIIHIILTQIFEPDRNYFLPIIDTYSCSYIYKNPRQLISSHFIYNSLVWEVSKPGDYSIQRDQIERIKHLWNLRIHEKVNSFNLDPDDILKEVHMRDAKDFPCADSKKYENNSSGINILDLQAIIGKKYPSPFFEIVFNILGNDSTSYRSDRKPYNLSFVSYPTDGIDFDFADDNTLRCIYIKPYFKGILFNNLKMTDNKDEIKKKLGDPKEYVNIPRYKYDWIYEKYKMLIAFGYTNRIIDLQINNGINP